MAKLTKKAKALQGKVDSLKLYPLEAALSLVKEHATAKFDDAGSCAEPREGTCHRQVR